MRRSRMISTEESSGEEASQVGEAFGGDGFWCWGVVEDFDRDPAVVRCFAQCFDDGCVLHLAHAGSAEVRVVGVEVDGPVLALADDLADGLVLVAHGFYVEVELAGRMVDGLAESDGFGGAGEEVRFDMAERLHGDGDAEWAAVFGSGAQDFGGAGEGIIVIPAGFERALHRAAPDHDGAAHGVAEVGEMSGAISGRLTDRVFRCGEVEACGFCQQPVESHDFHASIAHLIAEQFRIRCGECLHVFRQRERRNFKAGVADLRGDGGGFGEGDGAEGLVADGVAHDARKGGQAP